MNRSYISFTICWKISRSSGRMALELGLIDRIATLREAVELTKNRTGSKRVRLVAYRRPLGHRPNYYAQRPHSFGSVLNLINVELAAGSGRMTPRFMYLWAPGTRLLR